MAVVLRYPRYGVTAKRREHVRAALVFKGPLDHAGNISLKSDAAVLTLAKKLQGALQFTRAAPVDVLGVAGLLRRKVRRQPMPLFAGLLNP